MYVPAFVLRTYLYIISYFVMSSEQLYNLGISDRGGTIYLLLQRRFAGNEIRLAGM